ncbi:MAG: hypothetical protein ACOVSW_11615 [Candidatus Kapaibacteriota bacterium]|jgi:hypothetical protein
MLVPTVRIMAALQASVTALLQEGYTVEKIDHALTQGEFVGKLIHRKNSTRSR